MPQSPDEPPPHGAMVGGHPDPAPAFSAPAEGLTAAERASAAGWAEARRLRALLLDRQVPQTVVVWELVPEPGEVFFYDVRAEYERYYATDVRYSRAGGFFLGSPAFVVAGLTLNGLVQSQRRRAAEARAQTQWREWADVRLVVSNRRLACFVRGQWLSFPYAAMTAVHPAIEQWALVCEFEGTSPLRLRGVDAPLTAVLTVFGTHGPAGVAGHPGLASLGGPGALQA